MVKPIEINTPRLTPTLGQSRTLAAYGGNIVKIPRFLSRSELILLGLLLELFFGYLRSNNIDGVEKSYIIPTLACYISCYIATYLTGSSKK